MDLDINNLVYNSKGTRSPPKRLVSGPSISTKSPSKAYQDDLVYRAMAMSTASQHASPSNLNSRSNHSSPSKSPIKTMQDDFVFRSSQSPTGGSTSSPSKSTSKGNRKKKEKKDRMKKGNSVFDVTSFGSSSKDYNDFHAAFPLMDDFCIFPQSIATAQAEGNDGGISIDCDGNMIGSPSRKGGKSHPVKKAAISSNHTDNGDSSNPKNGRRLSLDKLSYLFRAMQVRDKTIKTPETINNNHHDGNGSSPSKRHHGKKHSQKMVKGDDPDKKQKGTEYRPKRSAVIMETPTEAKARESRVLKALVDLVSVQTHQEQQREEAEYREEMALVEAKKEASLSSPLAYLRKMFFRSTQSPLPGGGNGVASGSPKKLPSLSHGT